jgi:hypothetical protein
MNGSAKPLYKALDAVMTASLRPKRPFSGNMRRLFRPRLSNYERLSTLVNLADGVMPGVSRGIFGSLYKPTQLPFAVGGIRLFSFGSGSTVFLLENGGRRAVLKVYRRSLGKKEGDLFSLAEHFKGKYETVASWYRGPYGLVPPSAFLILHGPLLGRSAVAVLQAYIAGEKRDFFRSFSDEDLLDLLEGPEFRAQFLFFAQKTLQVYRESGQCFDFIGRDNLMVVQEGAETRLAIIDYGLFEVERLRSTAPQVYRQVEEYLCRIEWLYQRLL